MKLKIIKKTIKEGTRADGRKYQIKSLFVSFTEIEVYEKIVSHLKAQGGSQDMIEKFCRPNDYNGNISYAFGLNCSNFTFDNVEKFGILDAKVIFSVTESGYINAKIAVVDKKEQVISYQAPEDFVDGWACGNPEQRQEAPQIQVPDLSGLPELPQEEGNVLPF